MGGLDATHWLALAGLGAIWLGAQIVLVGAIPLGPRAAVKGSIADRSSPAFQRFWLRQYQTIGVVLVALGVVFAAWGFSR